MATLLIRRLWTMYKKIRTDDGAAKQELLLAQDAFYNGAGSVLKVLAHMLEHSELDELHRTIQRHGRQIDVIQRTGRRAILFVSLELSIPLDRRTFDEGPYPVALHPEWTHLGRLDQRFANVAMTGAWSE